MSTLQNIPSNKNLLSPNGFRFILNRTPGINYFTFNTSLPSVSIGELDIETPLGRLPLPAHKLRYEPFSLRFRVDEDLTNYLEIYNWLLSLGNLETKERVAYVKNSIKQTNIVSDGTLIVLTSNKNPGIQITFADMFPVSLTELTFDASVTDIEYLEATATFRYKLYTIEKI